MSNALAQSIAPVALDTFFEETWEKQPLLVKGRGSNPFAHLISTGDIDDLLASGTLRAPMMRMTKGGTNVPRNRYMHSNVRLKGQIISDLPDPMRVYALYQRGASIILEATQRSWQPLLEFCKDWERVLGYQTMATTLLTPPGSRGLSVHYDTQENFILQVAGKKHWRVYESAFDLPLASQCFRQDFEVGKCLLETCLEPGDLLYTPRGFAHEPWTTDSYSLHITISVIPFTWHDALSEVLQAALKECEDELEWRHALPVGFDSDPAAAATIRDELVRRLPGVFERLKPDLPYEKFSRRHAKRLPYLPGQLDQIHQTNEITLDTRLRLRPQAPVTMLPGDPDLGIKILHLRFLGKELVFPRYTQGALEFILHNKTFTIKEIPDPLPDREKLSVVRTLLQAGFLRIDSAEHNGKGS